MVQCFGLGAFITVAWVQSLVWELRSPKPHGAAKHKIKNRKEEMIIYNNQEISTWRELLLWRRIQEIHRSLNGS